MTKRTRNFLLLLATAALASLGLAACGGSSDSSSSSTAHNVQIEDSSGGAVGGTDTITASNTSTTADLQPGTYTFFCSIPGHREAGMEGTITVK